LFTRIAIAIMKVRLKAVLKIAEKFSMEGRK